MDSIPIAPHAELTAIALVRAHLEGDDAAVADIHERFHGREAVLLAATAALARVAWRALARRDTDTAVQLLEEYERTVLTVHYRDEEGR